MILIVSYQRYVTAGILIFLSAIIDRYDGRLARKYHIETTCGLWLDSINDFVSFLFAPMLMMWHLDLVLSAWLAGILILIYTFAGLYRLKRFHHSEDAQRFQGLPTTVAGVFVVMVSLFFYALSSTHTLFAFFILTLSVLMMANFTVKKI